MECSFLNGCEHLTSHRDRTGQKWNEAGGLYCGHESDPTWTCNLVDRLEFTVLKERKGL